MQRKLKIAALALAGLAFAVFAWVWFAPCGFGGCAPVSDLERFQIEGSQLFDVNGKPFGTLATVNRRAVALDSVPGYLPKAFLAVEDRRFYEHNGVDWKRLLGALRSNVRAGGVSEGGSTITMQLARNLFPERLPYQERSIRRKLLEVRIARQIERAYPKNKILELYLNRIYLGEGSYGVDAAAREYFGKPAEKLTLAEAALIGGLPKAPSKINPRQDRAAARERRNLVLGEMAKAGFITAAQAEAARAEPIRLTRAARQKAQRAAWIMDRVRREMEDKVGERVYTAGLKIYTTYDPAMQAAAEEELRAQLAAIERGAFGRYTHPRYGSAEVDTSDAATPYLQGVVMVMDPANGEVRALVGGRDYDDSKFNRAFQALRQPGSAFKPFVYLTALQRGIPPTERIADAPVRVVLAGGRPWEPKNYTPEYLGPITLREALTRSKNTVTVRLSQQVGMPAVIQTARDLGISTPLSTVPAAALGAVEVRPAELIASYAAFGNGGQRVEPHVVRRVEDRSGGTVWEAPEASDQAIDPAEAYVLTTMLRDVVDRGTATRVRAAGFSGPAAGKTGTTNAATDVWFVGYTPNLVAGVWMGFDHPRTIVPGASGGTLAAPVWGRMMRRIYAGRPLPADWPRPPGVVTAQVDRATGAPVDPSCPAQGATYTEYFAGSVPPSAICPGPGVYALGLDSVWQDAEWGGGMAGDTVGLTDLRGSGIDWPELEQRRVSGADEVPLPAPNIPDAEQGGPPPRAVVPTTPVPSPPRRETEPLRRRGSVETEPPPPPPSSDTPPPETSPPPREPRVLGRPVTPAEPPPATPAPTP